MNIKEKLDMLVEYERVDAPTSKREKLAWKMYISDKIVKFLGERELSLIYNLPLSPQGDEQQSPICKMVANML